MEIIPVIDLMHGQVVHARFGQRHAYQPIQSTLCDSSDPHDAIQGLLRLYPFQTCYIADIDAIQKTGSHEALICDLAAQFSHIQFWLDNGTDSANSLQQTPLKANIQLIIGSENLSDLAAYQAIQAEINNDFILSLDRKNGKTLGPDQLHTDAHRWPQAVICMNLNQVGSGLGPDLLLLQALMRLNQTRSQAARIYAAGGIRSIQDCHALRQAGIAGALIATTLHQGQINQQDLQAFYQV